LLDKIKSSIDPGANLNPKEMACVTKDKLNSKDYSPAL